MFQEIVVVGLDLAKIVFYVHVIDAEGKPVIRCQLRRAEVLKHFADLASGHPRWWSIQKIPQPVLEGPARLKAL